MSKTTLKSFDFVNFYKNVILLFSKFDGFSIHKTVEFQQK